MHEKTILLSVFAQQVSLKISQNKTEATMLNVPNPSPIKVNGDDLPTTGNTVRHDGRAGSDIKNRLNQASFYNVKQRVEVVPVPHQGQPKAVLKLLISHPIVRIRMLEDDQKRPQ